jgi:hypothetical protein
MIGLRLQRGGDANIVKLDGELVTIDSSVASAPGSRLDGSTDDGRSVRLKVYRCVRQGERFAIEGRFIDLTRELRLSLSSRLANG